MQFQDKSKSGPKEVLAAFFELNQEIAPPIRLTLESDPTLNKLPRLRS